MKRAESLCSLTIWAVAVALPAAAAADTEGVILTVHVARGDNGEGVAQREWIDERVETASERLAGAGVSFSWQPGSGDGVPIVIDSVAGRHGLAEIARPDRTVHVFVVQKLADKDIEGAWLNGVHWRYHGGKPRLRGRRYIILSAESRYVDTLAHELGHFFGLSHQTDPGNLMTTPIRKAGAAALDDRQLRRIKKRVRQWLRRSP